VPEQVTLYYAGRCAECRRARDTLTRLLGERGIDFRALDVETDLEARDRLILVSGQIGAPVVVVDKREIVGLDPRRLRHYLGVDVGEEHKAHW
jgi:glutaredoxin